MRSASNVLTLTELLSDTRSNKRRIAAKKLRQLADPRAADALLTALQKEVVDPRTWETQYQLIMAIGSCVGSGQMDSDRAARARKLLESILDLELEPMVHLAAGDIIVRLSADVDSAVLKALKSGSISQAVGAIRALAMSKIDLAESTIVAIVKDAAPKHRELRFWVAAAAVNWPREIVVGFLRDCLADEKAETRRAAQAALDGRHLQWKPL